MGGLAVLALLVLYGFLAMMVFNAAKTTSTKVIALLLILLIPTADAAYGRIKLQQMCKAEGGLKVYRVAHNVEGFADDNAGDYYVKQHGYQFAEKLPTNGLTVRWSQRNAEVVVEENVTAKSKYRVYFKRIGWINDNYLREQDVVEEIANNEILAIDTQIAFNGGWAERLVALFSDAGGGTVAWCDNVASDHWQRKVKLILTTLKHSGE